MIGILLILITIIFFCAWNLCQKHQKIYAILSSIFLLITISAVILNIHNHLGMHLHTVTTKASSHHIKPISKQAKIIIKEPLGSAKKHQVVVYKAHNHIKHTQLDISNKNQIQGTKHKYGYIQYKRQEWKYSKQGAFWFKLMQPKSDIKQTDTIIYIPKSWTVLSEHQAKAMKSFAKQDAKVAKQQMQTPQGQAMAKQQMQQILQHSKLAKEQQQNIKSANYYIYRAKMEHKTQHISQIQAFLKRDQKFVIRQAKRQLKNKMKAQIIKKAIQQAKHVPVGYKG